METDVWILKVSEWDGSALDFEVNGETAARGCAKAEFAAATTRRVIVLDPQGNVADDLDKTPVTLAGARHFTGQ